MRCRVSLPYFTYTFLAHEIEGLTNYTLDTEVVTLGVNYRVAPQDSIGKVMHNIVSYIKPIAKKYGVKIKAFEADDEYASYATDTDDNFAVMETDSTIEPLYEVDYNATLVLTSSQKTQVAPVSPSVDDAVWDVFSGTIQHSFAFEDGKVVPVGELMTGNTDTRHYLGKLPSSLCWLACVGVKRRLTLAAKISPAMYTAGRRPVREAVTTSTRLTRGLT